MHRGMKYAGMRAASNVLLRDVNVSLIIEEMYRGTNVIYADFTDYDELAHHCGPERVESFEALDGVDRAIATLEKAAKDAPRPYRFVVLSDHGQSLGATFKQRYGQSLGEVVRDLMSGRATLVQAKTAAEGSTFVNSFLSEITRSRGIGPSVARAALAGQTKDGVVDLDAEEVPPPADESTIAVVGSGNLGLVWFTGHDHRLSFEELEELHPDLVASLASPPGRRDADGPDHRARRRSCSAATACATSTEDRVEGEDPTTLFGPHTIMSLQREDAMDARAGPAADQPVRPGARRGRRVRGADRLARRPRRSADRAVHPPSGRLEARRAGPARRARRSTATSGAGSESIGIALGKPGSGVAATPPPQVSTAQPMPITD